MSCLYQKDVGRKSGRVEPDITSLTKRITSTGQKIGHRKLLAAGAAHQTERNVDVRVMGRERVEVDDNDEHVRSIGGRFDVGDDVLVVRAEELHVGQPLQGGILPAN